MARGRVLCIHPWIYDFAAYDLWIRPLGLLSIAAVLRDAGYQVDWIDCLDRAHPELLKSQNRTAPKDQRYGCGHYSTEIVEKPEAVKGVPRHFRRYGLPPDLFESLLDRVQTPDVVFVTSKMTYWYPGVQDVIRRVKRCFPGVPVVLGGTYATLCTEHARRYSGADEVCPGEGEREARRLVARLLGLPSLTAPLCLTPDGEYPIPAHDLIHHRIASAVLTTRGCPMHCTYCASDRLTSGFRMYSTERVLQEIDVCFELGTRHFAFYDDALLMRAEEHIHPILEGIIQRQYPVDFHTPNAVHASCIDTELACQLHRAGFRTIRMGLETIDPARQRQTGGKVTNEAFIEAVKALRGAGFQADQIAAYVLMGLPNQTFSELEATVQFVHRQGAQVKLAFYSPIPGTRDWSKAVEQGQIAADADPLLHNNTLLPLRTDITWDALERFKRWVHTRNQEIGRS